MHLLNREMFIVIILNNFILDKNEIKLSGPEIWCTDRYVG